MEHKMDYPTLYTTAFSMVAQGSKTTWANLTESEREQLTAAAVKDIGVDAIEDALIGTTLSDKLIEALQEDHVADRNVLLKNIGELLLKTAMEHCKEIIEEKLEEVLPLVAQEQGLISEGALELQRLIADDNRQRARDMRI
jgi:HD-like signal output (HDOD) protein